MYARLKPHNYAYDPSQPLRVSNDLKIPSPVLETASNWIREEDELLKTLR